MRCYENVMRSYENVMICYDCYENVMRSYEFYFLVKFDVSIFRTSEGFE